MKKLIQIVLVLAVALASCTKEDIFNTYAIDFDETITHNKDVELTFSGIEDSRCPTDVACVWEGQADIELTTYFDDDDTPTIFNLIKRAGFPDLADTTLNGYHFRLLEVDPYPARADDLPQEEEYTIRLLVEAE